MCGIAGFIDREPKKQVLSEMLKTISHRGPDGEGEWINSEQDWIVHLGHRRLSIIDIAGGAQPLGNEDGKVQITFNGEIFNFLDLRETLRQNHTFKTQSDTEVIVHAFEQYGYDFLKMLNGMFAFALWNSNTQELLLARDYAGIKPLYYTQLSSGGIAFASELSTLFKHPQVKRKTSITGLSSYFFLDYSQSPESMIDGIYKLNPGHFIVWKNGTLSQQTRFFELPTTQEMNERPNTERLADELWQKLNKSVQRQLISDVPVGVFLSGGIDSSCVAYLAQKNKREPIKTFSIAFKERDFDESGYAKTVAEQIGSMHFEKTVSIQDLLERIDEIFNHVDEPFADPSFIPTYILSELASEHVKVALGGDAGDELWAGYPTYLAHRARVLLDLMPTTALEKIVTPVLNQFKVKEKYQSLEWKLKRLLSRYDRNPVLGHLRWMSNTDLPDLEKLIPSFKNEFVQTLGLLSSNENDLTNRLLKIDFQTYMTGSVLTKVDRASMAHGLEVRPPFLDLELVRWAYRLPSKYKLHFSTGKFLLKKAAEHKLPEQILHRKKKGFGIPLIQWTKKPLQNRIQNTLQDSPAFSTGLLNRDLFISWNQAHLDGREDRSKPLWALLILDKWMKKYDIS